MAVRRDYVGRIAVKLVDGRKLEFSIYKSGGTIWIDDHIVAPNRSYSWAGVDGEIGQLFSSAIEERRWIEYTGKPMF